MANYAVDPEILRPFVPSKTELDFWSGTCYVSLVGFMFVNTRVLGIKIPFHTNFEEVNLRFYVRHMKEGEWRRGVVFIKEIVPRHVLTFVANTIYKEHYETMPMDHQWDAMDNSLNVQYRWKKKEWSVLTVETEKQPVKIDDGSEEEFMTEHYWGYTKIGKHTSEYGVEHPRWQVYPTKSYQVDVDFATVYGPSFSFLSNMAPKSVFLAEGSEVRVLGGTRI